MGGFLRFVTRSRYHAIAISSLSALIPPFSFVGGAIIGLATLRYGVTEGASVLAGSAVVLAAFMLAFAGSAVPAALFVLVTGLPALALCALLRATSSQGHVLAAATVVTAAAIVALYLFIPDPLAWWMDMFEVFLADPAADVDPQTLEFLQTFIMGLPVAVMVTAMGVVFLARWGHAALDNPGGFGREFRDLRVGWRFAAGAGIVAVFVLVAAPAGAGLGHTLLMLVVAACALQGIALVHGLVARRRGARIWIIAMYASLVLVTPAAVLALSLAGFSDVWIDYRTRFGKSS